jgi:hypothetical protein
MGYGFETNMSGMAGPGNNPVQGFSTGRANHWEFLRLWTPPRQGRMLVVSWIMTRVRIWEAIELSVDVRGCCE